MLEYNSITNPRTQKASVGSTGRANAVGFAIDRMGYFGLGRNSSNTKLSDFWQYDQANNTWIQKGNFPGGARTYMSGTSTGGYGYIGFGVSNVSDYNNDFWMYYPATDTWVQKSGINVGRNQAAIFELGGRIYVGTGYSGTRLKDLWEYTPEGYGIDNVAADDIIIQYCSGTNNIIIEGPLISTVNIYNISGQKIVSRGFNYQASVVVDAGEIPTGMYLVEIILKNRSLVKKLFLN